MWTARSHRGTDARALKKRRLAFSFAALLAVFLQAFVVQTHIHAIPVAPISLELPGGGVDHGAHEQASAGGSHQISCAICQALAAGASATLPPATPLIAADHVGERATLALALAPRALSHAWQSRAPPSFL